MRRLAALLLVTTLALAACAGVAVGLRQPLPGPWGEALAAFAPAHGDIGEPPALPDGAGGVLVADASLLGSGSSWPAERRAELAAFVQRGGRLVLFGHAAHLAAALGVEPELPQRSVFRWGFDDRAVAGEARLGLHVTSGELAELFDGLLADGTTGAGDVVFVAGDTPCTAPLCTWTVAAPQRGHVLARLAVERDGVRDSGGAPVVVHWRVGDGDVLACGLVPRLDHGDAGVRAAATTFVQRCAAWARRDGELVAVVAPPAAAALPALPADAAPSRSAPLLAHWGWQLARHSGGDERAADELIDEALAPSWAAGADLCTLELADADGAVPLVWNSADPLRPAPSFESRPDSRHWHAHGFGDVATAAHTRGMLALGALDTLPVGDRAPERLAALRFLARELACVRRLGAGALDGVTLRSWLPDEHGWSLAMLQDFQPAAALVRTGELAPPIAGAPRALDADDGALRGLPFRGVSSAWRDGFAAADFPFGVLDARARDDAGGGDSHADWIVTQANDFVRARRGGGAAMWWRAHDPATLGQDTVDYVHGVSLEPLRAAVAMPLAATGTDGVRAAGAALAQRAPRTFGAHVEAPAGVHVLQNNWLRLLGSGGELRFDPRGAADFGAGAMRLSSALLRTRLFGGRPDGNAVRSERLDFFAGGRRGEGGYGTVARVGGAGGELLPPALLQPDGAPAWPAAVAFGWHAAAGYHELELQHRAVRGRGIVTVTLDGVLLRALPFDATVRSAAVVIPVHVARQGPRDLVVTVLQADASAGARLALDRLVLRRAGDVGVEARVLVPAGSIASLEEASQSSYHAERVELTAIADLPAFVLRLRCERAVRNLQVERVLAFPEHRTLAATAGGDGAQALREPFVLRAAEPALPDVVVAPLQLGRHETLRWVDGEVHWRSAPESGSHSRLGVLLCPRGDGPRWLAHVRTVLGAVAEPLVVELGARAQTTLHTDVPLPWTRVLRLPGAPATPFLVREHGEWFWRGTQAGPDGDRWLRVVHTPGDVVEIAGGAAVLARTRPGPGSLRRVALRDPEPLAVTARVLQCSALAPPSVVLARDFGDVEIDGVPWAHHDGRTVFLPDRVGVHRVVARERTAGAPTPHVRATRAPLLRCEWRAASRELVLEVAATADRPPALPWTAVLAGPRPVAVDGGELVDDTTLRFADAEAAAAARAGGVLLRLTAGTCRVRYAD